MEIYIFVKEGLIAMSEVSKLLAGYSVPKVAKVRQTFNNDLLEDVEGTVRKGLEEKCAEFKPGARIAITCRKALPCISNRL